MKKLIFHPAVLLCLAALPIASCSKKGDDSSAPTKTEMLTASSWKFDKAEADLNLDGTADTPIPSQFLEDCSVDNVLTFNKDMTGVVDEGALKCDASDPQTTPFTWVFKADETILSIPTALITGVDGDVKLVSISATSMVLMKEIEVDPFLSPSGKANAILTLKH